MELAYVGYCKENLNRHATRTTMFFADLLKSKKNFVELHQKLIRCAERDWDRLCSAMLYEQSAFAFLFISQFRHFAFRIIVAGLLKKKKKKKKQKKT